VPVKLFSSEFFPWFFALHVELGSARGGDVVGPKVFGKSLPRLETLQSTPLFTTLFSTAPQNERDQPLIA